MTEPGETIPVGADQTLEEAVAADPTHGIPTQPEYDVAALRGALDEERKAFAIAKLRWHVANRFGIKGAHPQQLAKEAGEHSDRIGLVLELLEQGEIAGPGLADTELLVPVKKLEVPKLRGVPVPDDAG